MPVPVLWRCSLVSPVGWPPRRPRDGLRRIMQHDPYEHTPTFSEVHGLQDVPELPRLKDISTQARNNLWSTLWRHIRATAIHGAYRLGEPWRTVLATGAPEDDGLFTR